VIYNKKISLLIIIKQLQLISKLLMVINITEGNQLTSNVL